MGSYEDRRRTATIERDKQGDDVDQVDPVRVFRHALTLDELDQLGSDPLVAAWARKACDAGVDPLELASWVAHRIRGLDNAGQVMRARLRAAADVGDVPTRGVAQRSA